MTPELEQIIRDAKDPSHSSNVFTSLYAKYKRVREKVVAKKIQGDILKQVDGTIVSLSLNVKDLKNITNEESLLVAAEYVKTTLDSCHQSLDFLESLI